MMYGSNNNENEKLVETEDDKIWDSFGFEDPQRMVKQAALSLVQSVIRTQYNYGDTIDKVEFIRKYAPGVHTWIISATSELMRPGFWMQPSGKKSIKSEETAKKELVDEIKHIGNDLHKYMNGYCDKHASIENNINHWLEVEREIQILISFIDRYDEWKNTPYGNYL